MHIRLTDGDRVITDSDAEAVAMTYAVPNGVFVEAQIRDGLDAFRIVSALDKLRSRILDDNPMLRVLLDNKDKFVKETIEIDLAALRDMKEKSE